MRADAGTPGQARGGQQSAGHQGRSGVRVAVTRVAMTVPATRLTENGRKAVPVAAAPMPRTCCMYRDMK
ncbi:hypothetical protein GCM10020254_06630 [Streptomyces goshikiensis]